MGTESDLNGRVLAITGVDGFVGRYVATAAVNRGATVIGIGRARELNETLAAQLGEYISTDLRKSWPLSQPVDAIVHLAGLSAVGPSFAEPQRYIEANSSIVTQLCEALLEHTPLEVGVRPRIVGVSTGAVYSSPRDNTAIDERTEVNPTSPYAVSKLLVEQQLRYYKNRGLDTVVARPFNHIGAGQGPGFLLPDLAGRLRNLPEGEALTVGDLTNARDFSHVADVADAYLDLAFAPELHHFIYNVASGSAVRGQELLELICEQLDRDVPELQVNPALIRPTDPKSIVGSAERLTADTGWRPRRSVHQAVAEFVAAATA